MKLLIINGPNLNLLGKRNPAFYGTQTLQELEESCITFAKKQGIHLCCKQSNHEGTIIDWIQQAENNYNGIILNPGAYAHYSYAIRDAIESVTIPVVEVHLSDVTSRETFRRQLVLTDVVALQIKGKGLKGYYEAISYFSIF